MSANRVAVGVHHHRHGTSCYVFPAGTTYAAFLAYLGDEFEEQDDEWIEIDDQVVIDLG